MDVSISGANQTVGHVVSTLGGVSINSAGLAGKTVFVNGVENEALVLNDSGTFEFSSVDLSETVIFEVELENSSSAIGISDVVLQLRHIVGLTELASSQFIAGDIDGDSQISISDVVSNLRVIVGLAESPKGQLVYQDEQRNYDLQHGSVYDFELLIPGDVDGSMSDVL